MRSKSERRGRCCCCGTPWVGRGPSGCPKCALYGRRALVRHGQGPPATLLLVAPTCTCGLRWGCGHVLCRELIHESQDIIVKMLGGLGSDLKQVLHEVVEQTQKYWQEQASAVEWEAEGGGRGRHGGVQGENVCMWVRGCGCWGAGPIHDGQQDEGGEERLCQGSSRPVQGGVMVECRDCLPWWRVDLRTEPAVVPARRRRCCCCCLLLLPQMHKQDAAYRAQVMDLKRQMVQANEQLTQTVSTYNQVGATTAANPIGVGGVESAVSMMQR